MSDFPGLPEKLAMAGIGFVFFGVFLMMVGFIIRFVFMGGLFR